MFDKSTGSRLVSSSSSALAVLCPPPADKNDNSNSNSDDNDSSGSSSSAMENLGAGSSNRDYKVDGGLSADRDTDRRESSEGLCLQLVL